MIRRCIQPTSWFRHRAIGPVVVVGLVAGIGVSPAAGADTPPVSPVSQPSGPQYFETFAPDGTISMRPGGPDHAPPTLPLPESLRERAAGGPTVIPMHMNGASANRIDLVFVGDGYTAAEQPQFAAAAERAWQNLMSYEPYKTYQNFFNAERVDIVSPVSGISADPTQDVKKTTPLGMHFWCHGIDRLLCVNDKAASAYSNLVPGRNRVIAIANTTTYGGAGGSITTLSGHNVASGQVLVHEMGHTIGGLGDEYDVPYDTASGAQSEFVNVSDQAAAQMTAASSKWARWIGARSGDGSTVGAYEGANYYKKGFYRPSADSEMRTLGQPFNPPSIEQLIKTFYVSRIGQGSIDPIDTQTPAPTSSGISDRNTTVSVSTVPLVGASYQISWDIGGTVVPGATSDSLDLRTAPLKQNVWNQVTVSVKDTTPQMRDEAFRTKEMTKTRSWRVWGSPAKGSNNPPSTANPAYGFVGTGDWNGDGKQDLVARDNASGSLYLYPGTGTADYTTQPRVLIGSGWGGYSFAGIADVTGTGHPGIMAREDGTGNLWFYPGNGTGLVGTRTLIGSGWGGYSFAGVADFTHTGSPGIIARNDATSTIWYFPGNGTGVFGAPTQLGTGWGGYTFVGIVDATRDGNQDLVARNDTTGALLLYPGDGTGALTGPIQLGTGWGGYAFAGVTDWDNDGYQDILARPPGTGSLLLYTRAATPNSTGGRVVQIGAGW